MKRLLKEPLLHFVLLGATLFGLYSLVGTKESEPAKIVVSMAKIENIANAYARTWQRPPSPQELIGLIEDHIREEVYYREGKALGLDRDDTVIRRRMRQKMEFMAEDMAAVEPTDEQLSAYLAANAARFKTDDRLSFRHVYVSAARHDAMENDAKAVAARLTTASSDTDPAAIGDPFLLGHEFRAQTRADVSRAFGGRFADQLFQLEQGRWQGPIPSSHGLHLVLISDRSEGGAQPLEEVRAQVRREWMYERRQEAEANLYKKLRARYEIVVESPSGEGTAGSDVRAAK